MKILSYIGYISLFVFMLGLGVYTGFFDGISEGIGDLNTSVISFLPPEFTFFFVMIGIVLCGTLINTIRS